MDVAKRSVLCIGCGHLVDPLKQLNKIVTHTEDVFEAGTIIASEVFGAVIAYVYTIGTNSTLVKYVRESAHYSRCKLILITPEDMPNYTEDKFDIIVSEPYDVNKLIQQVCSIME